MSNIIDKFRTQMKIYKYNKNLRQKITDLEDLIKYWERINLTMSKKMGQMKTKIEDLTRWNEDLQGQLKYQEDTKRHES